MAEFKSGKISFSYGAPQRSPEADRAQLMAVQQAAQRGDIAEAGRLADAALAAGLRHPMLFNLAADRWEREGRFDDALALLQQTSCHSCGRGCRCTSVEFEGATAAAAAVAAMQRLLRMLRGSSRQI